MEEDYDGESESNWQIPNDEYDEGGGNEAMEPLSEYQKFFDCHCDTSEKHRKPRQHKVKTNRGSLSSNMDSAEHFRKSLSEITMITHNILNSIKLCIDNRNLKRSKSERSKCFCGHGNSTTGHYTREKHLQRITDLADKFLKTFVEPCKESMDQLFTTCEQYNRNNYEKYQCGHSSEVREFPIVIPFKPYELIVPVTVGKGRVIKTFQHQHDSADSSIEDTQSCFIPNLMYDKDLPESSSDLFSSVKDTSYLSCEDSESIIDRFPFCGALNRKQFDISAAMQFQCSSLPKLTEPAKYKTTDFLPKSVSSCVICSKPINCCECVKLFLTKTHVESQMPGLAEEMRTTMPEVNVDFQTMYGATPAPIAICKKCGKERCVCDSSAPEPSTTLLHSTKPILCSKCNKPKCTCKVVPMSSQMCNICLKPIEQCICEKPQTSKTSKYNLSEVHTNYCKWCGKSVDKCICDQPRISKKIESSKVMLGSSLDSCVCDKLLEKKCPVCGNDLNKCICKEPQLSSKAITSQSKLPNKSPLKKLKSLTVPIVCQCGLKPERCKCKKPIPINVCSKCGPNVKNCVCPTKLPRTYCLKCHRPLDKCICKVKHQTVETPKVCATCGNAVERCTCSKLKSPKTITCNRCWEPPDKCICKKVQSPAHKRKAKVLEQFLCNRCGVPLDKCICKKTQAMQTDAYEEICRECGNLLSTCTCRINQAVQTDREEICEDCGKELSACTCNKTEATQTDPPNYQHILCDQCKSKIYVNKDEEPIPCTCDARHVHSEKELEDLMAIHESDLDEDIVTCVCDLREAVPLSATLEEIMQDEPSYVGETVMAVEPLLEEVIPEVSPKVTPEVSPKVTPKVTPEVTPKVTPKVTPEVSPKVTPEVPPEVPPEIPPEVPPEIPPEVPPEVPPEIPPEVTPKVTPEESPSVEENVVLEEAPDGAEAVTAEEPPSVEEIDEPKTEVKPEPPPKPPRKVYRLAFPQHKDLEICTRCRFQPSPLIDQDGRVFCPGNCGCCLCPWKPRLTPSKEDALKHRKFKVCKCRKRGTIFTKFNVTDSDCSQVSYFDECPCRDIAEAKHLQMYGFDMWDVNEKLLQKFRGEQVYLRDVRELIRTKIPSTKFLSSKLYLEEFNDATGSDIDNKDNKFGK